MKKYIYFGIIILIVIIILKISFKLGDNTAITGFIKEGMTNIISKTKNINKEDVSLFCDNGLNGSFLIKKTGTTQEEQKFKNFCHCMNSYSKEDLNLIKKGPSSFKQIQEINNLTYNFNKDQVKCTKENLQ